MTRRMATGNIFSHYGEQNCNSKLKETDIHEIRRLSKEGMTQAAIGRCFDVSNVTIHKVLKRITWAWVK